MWLERKFHEAIYFKSQVSWAWGHYQYFDLLILSAAKLATGHLLHSSSLVADGFNNVSDIIGNVALLIGIRMARQPADRDHRFGHWKIEDLASLVTSIIMFYVGFDVLRDTIQKIISREETVIDPLGATLGIISAAIMFLFISTILASVRIQLQSTQG